MKKLIYILTIFILTDFELTTIHLIHRCKPITKENVMVAIIDLQIDRPEMAFRHCLLESGHLKSDLVKSNKNLFGMKEAYQRTTTCKFTKNNHAYYDYWIESIMDYKYWQLQSPIMHKEKYFDYLVRRGYFQDNKTKYKKMLLGITIDSTCSKHLLGVVR